MPFNIEEANRLMRERRSIYPGGYSGESVSDEVIQDMLENANWAPNHKLTEPWRFTVFQGEGLKEFVSIHGQVHKKAGKKMDESKLKKLEGKIKKCSHIIAIGMNRNKSLPKMEEISSVASAVQNMQLTATAHGAGCYWSTGGITFMPEANKFFGLKKKDLFMGFLFVGMPKSNKRLKGKRKPIEDKVTWVKA